MLYRCHCGCDGCGVVSCELKFDGDHVVWDRLTYENDDGPMLVRDPHEDPLDSPLLSNGPLHSNGPLLSNRPFPPNGPQRFVFERAQYQAELERHFAR